MSSLRRDLIERRLWPVVIVLIAAIAAVPFLLHGHRSGSAAAVVPVPRVAATTREGSGKVTPSAGESIPVSVSPRQKLRTSTTRDPFLPVGQDSSAKKKKTVSVSSKTSPTSTAVATSSSTGATSSPASVPSPTSASTDSTAATGTTSTSAGPASTGAGQTPTPPTTTTSTTTTSTNATTTPIVKDPSTGATRTGPWTVYSVDVTVRAPGGTTTKHDIARLSPLPSATWPKLMFMGVADKGHDVVFALGTGVDASGPAACKPTHADCELIVLSKGQAEHLSYLLSDGTERTMVVRVDSIGSSVTRSAAQAATAFNRRSQVGLCELELGDPISFKYDAQSGSLQDYSSTACRTDMKAVPFPGTGNGL